MYIPWDAWRACTRWRSSPRCGPGWPACRIATSAGSTSSSGCSPSKPKLSASPTPRHLGGKVRELRFHLLRQRTRVTYWLAPGRRVILLTVFRKTRSTETAEVSRALHAQKVCEAEHGRAHEVFDREVN
jgi:Phage derived protein Gp49-like (DUF891)